MEPIHQYWISIPLQHAIVKLLSTFFSKKTLLIIDGRKVY